MLKAIERLIFSLLLRRISYRILDTEEVGFLRLAIEINSGQIDTLEALKKLKDAGSKFLQIKESKDYLIQEFNENGFYKWDGIKYFLFEYDLHLAENSKTDREKLIWSEFSRRDYETTEHIYPQKARSKCWTEPFKKFTPKERKKLKNSLGNLLPLSRRKNSSFQNKCFKDKVASKDSTVGFRYGGYSENEVTEYNDWTEKEILSRGLKLIEFMENRWELKIGNETDKIKFLGLEFLKKKNDRQQRLKRS